MLTFVGAAEKLMADQPVDHPLEYFSYVNWLEVQQASERGDDGR